jgi:hypothetical protein
VRKNARGAVAETRRRKMAIGREAAVADQSREAAVVDETEEDHADEIAAAVEASLAGARAVAEMVRQVAVVAMLAAGDHLNADEAAHGVKEVRLEEKKEGRSLPHASVLMQHLHLAI